LCYQKTTLEVTDAPLAVFHVEHNKRYRFRLINAASNVCPFQLQIENHPFDVISSDGSSIEPERVDTLYITLGERYDFVLDANQPVRDYWVRLRAMGPCMNKNEVFGVLRYHAIAVAAGEPAAEFVLREPPAVLDVYPDGRLFNSKSPGLSGVAISTARSHMTDNSLVNAQPDNVFYLFFGTPQVENRLLFGKNDGWKFMGEFKLLALFLMTFLL